MSNQPKANTKYPTGTTLSGLPYFYNILPEMDRKRSREGIYHPLGWLKLSPENDKWPLLSRAWVFQERLLSPRFLHVGWPELRWECKELSSCQCGDAGAEEKSAKLAYSAVLTPSDDEKTDLEQQRRDLIEHYSMLKITYGADRLPAFSGFAKGIVGEAGESNFMAGLFRDSLLVDMVWRIDDVYYPPDGGGRGDSQAPSWSWASADHDVRFPMSRIQGAHAKGGSLLETYVELVDTLYIPDTADPTGRVRYGIIRIRGRVFDCQVSGRSLSFASSDPDDAASPLKPGSREYQSVIRWGYVFPDKVLPEGSTTPVVCLRFARFKIMEEDELEKRESEEEYSLLLQPVEESPGRYKRVGVFRQDIRTSRGETQSSSFASGGREEVLTIV
jgi:hypothetical protein